MTNNTTPSDLLPCPFCGASARWVGGYFYEQDWAGEYVLCGSCGAKMPRHWPKRASNAVESWNTRAAIPDHQSAPTCNAGLQVPPPTEVADEFIAEALRLAGLEPMHADVVREGVTADYRDSRECKANLAHAATLQKLADVEDALAIEQNAHAETTRLTGDQGRRLGNLTAKLDKAQEALTNAHWRRFKASRALETISQSEVCPADYWIKGLARSTLSQIKDTL